MTLFTYKNIIYFAIAIFLLFILILIIIYFFFDVVPSQTGPLGDTVGGLFSPIIGFASVYLIIKAYREQKSSTFYSDFSKDIEEIKIEFKNISFMDSATGNVVGLESFSRCYNKIHKIFTNNTHREHNTNFLRESVTIFEKSASLYDRYISVKPMLIEEHSADLEKKFNLFVKIYLKLPTEIFEYYKFNIQDFIRKGTHNTITTGIPGDATDKIRIVELIDILERYQSAMKIFIQHQVVKENPKKKFILINTIIDEEKIMKDFDFKMYDFQA